MVLTKIGFYNYIFFENLGIWPHNLLLESALTKVNYNYNYNSIEFNTRLGLCVCELREVDPTSEPPYFIQIC